MYDIGYMPKSIIFTVLVYPDIHPIFLGLDFIEYDSIWVALL